MSAPLYASSDYLNALLSLMPRGRVWPKDPSSVQAQALACFTPTFVRSNQDANDLLVDAFPPTSVDLLPEWESTLGLPDPCAGAQPTIQLRQKQVVARFTNSGGQSITYFVNLAKTLGYDITITQFAPFRFGQSNFGTLMYGNAWAFAWQVNAPGFSIEQFKFGADAFGEPFAYWTNNILQCELNSYAPAHTTPIFDYS
jgi:uncharacterized protein YmfQ (DUF2313 family)